MLKTFVTFGANFPDDSIEEQGQTIKPAGEAIAHAFEKHLCGLGWRCAPVEQHSHYAWTFELFTKPRSINFFLQFPDQWLMFSKVRVSSMERIIGRDYAEVHGPILYQISLFLEADPRFSEIQWFTKDKFEAAQEKEQ